MANIFPGNEVLFNTVAAKYDRMRPTYVSELYEDIWNYGGFGEGIRAIEIGIGTGQATTPILDRGARVTAVELGNALAEYCRVKFVSYPNFSVVNLPFQDFDAPDNSCDLIFSASAFHWIPEEIGYKKVFRMLRPGGVFARFANHPYKDKGNEPLHQAMQVHYAEYMPASKADPVEYSEKAARERMETGVKYGFVDNEYRLYQRTRTFTADEYIQLLGTYSDHIALGDRQDAFYDLIRREINRFGGKYTNYDTIDLQLHRKQL